MTTAHDIAMALGEILDLAAAADQDGDATFCNASEDGAMLLAEGVSTCSFGEAGIMSANAGIELTLADGSKFQITIVQSR